MDMRLTASTTGFALAAAVTVLFNTVLAWAKDAYAPLQDFMKSIGGHHWTTHGLADLVVFVGLGFIFMRVKAVENMDAERVIRILAGSVAVSALGLVAWFVVR
jgi:hypothetical protein